MPLIHVWRRAALGTAKAASPPAKPWPRPGPEDVTVA